MVSSTSLNVVEKSIVPPGKYTVVGIDIDTTGRRLIDEIVQLAAFTPNERFQQYIMPYMNLNPAARQRHQVRVISIGFYRMLKSMQTYKIIKSKSEIAAVKDFLDWLEQIKAKDANSQGIILVYHEERKFIPYMILESLKKYNLLDRFANTVKSFANGLILAKSTVSENMQQLSLRKLSRALSNQAASAAAAGTSSQSLPNGVGCNEVTSTSNAAAAATTTTNNNANANVAAKVLNGDGGDVNGSVGGGGGSQQQPSQQPLQQQQQTSGGDGNNINNNNNKSSQQQSQSMTEREREYFDGNASVRARLAYEVALQLSNRDYKDPINSLAAYEKMLQAILKYAQPIECDLKELETQNQNLERQNSFRPIFLNYFKTTLYHRVRAVKFRIILAEQGYDLQTLNAIWTEKQKAGIAEVLQVIEELKPEDKTELTDLFDSYFDPNKTTIKPIVKNNNRRRNRRGLRSNRNDGNNVNSRAGNNIERGAGGDKQQQQQQVTAAAGGNGAHLPDSTTNDNQGSCGPNNNNSNNNAVSGGANNGGGNNMSKSVQSNGGGNNGGKPPRNRRNQRSRNNSVKNQSSAVNLQVAAAPAAVAPVAMPMVATN